MKYLLAVDLNLLQDCFYRALIFKRQSVAKIIETPLRFTKCDFRLLQFMAAMLGGLAGAIGIGRGFFDGFLRLIRIADAELLIGNLDQCPDYLDVLVAAVPFGRMLGLGFRPFQLLHRRRLLRALRLHNTTQQDKGCDHRGEFSYRAHFSFSIAIRR